MSPLVLSVVLALVSAVAYAAAAIVQERVAASASGPRYAPLRRPAWWGAVLLNGVGAALHVAALAYGPLSLVQPLGALTIVFALPMAALFVGRGAGRRARHGALMATAGLAGLLSLTTGADARSLGDGQRWLLTGAAFGAVGLLFACARLVGRPALRSVFLATAAGVSFGAASVFTKAVAGEWTPEAPLAEWTALLVLSAFAVAGLLLSQASYRGAGLAAPLATLTVVNPVVAAAVGVTLFGEGFRYGAAGAVAALICGAVAAGGLVELTLDRMGPAQAPPPAGKGPRGSDGDPARPEIGQGVDVGAVSGTRPDLEVEMRSRAVAGRA
ncbi:MULTISPECIES: DMT family transporter [unclassified Streptomyces]|uniref:DMT family transporter n=1 Tax=unclassified Streptomyces TaxID=2593676 RepID=UPI0006C1DED5|nr:MULTISPECIES: DMT family transporter [unclassified Streptomyces]KOX35428.1 membrane protein [Streptomyces sp. NRRL F-6491]KOX36258.1 membrane protein [Streptomyces sp. NRRL F-6492]